MKRYILAFLIICNSTVSWSQQPVSDEHKEIQTVVVGFFDGLSELNVDKIRSFSAPDIIILETGEVWNFDSLALRINARKARSADFKRINTFDFIETKVSGKTAWISYFNEAVMSSSGKTVKVKWLESVVLIKQKNEWRISLLHSTELSRTP